MLKIRLITNRLEKSADVLAAALVSCGAEVTYGGDLKDVKAAVIISGEFEPSYSDLKAVRDIKEKRIPLCEWVLTRGEASEQAARAFYEAKGELSALMDFLNLAEKHKEKVYGEKFELAQKLLRGGALSQGLQILTELSAARYKPAREELARIYTEGLGVKRDLLKAAHLRDGQMSDNSLERELESGETVSENDENVKESGRALKRDYIRLGRLKGEVLEWLPLLGDSSGHSGEGLLCISRCILGYARYDLLNREFGRSELYGVLKEYEREIFSGKERENLMRFDESFDGREGLYLSLLPHPKSLGVRLNREELEAKPLNGVEKPFGESTASNWYFLKDETDYEYKVAVSASGTVVNIPSRELGGIRPIIRIKRA